MDLIDTLWNVKTAAAGFGVVINIRFNRYIVECKESSEYSTSIRVSDLIDTLWNVKLLTSGRTF